MVGGLALFAVLFVTPSCVLGYCWQPGMNPSFKGPPVVEQVDLYTVRVSWDGLVINRQCTYQFLVKYWLRNSPRHYKVKLYD
jgi:hypothetical protein